MSKTIYTAKDETSKELAVGDGVLVTVGGSKCQRPGIVKAVNGKNLKVRFQWANGRTTNRDFPIDETSRLATGVVFDESITPQSIGESLVEQSPVEIKPEHVIDAVPVPRGGSRKTIAKGSKALPTYAEIAAMDAETRSKLAMDERAAARRAKAEKVEIPASPVNEWIKANPDAHKAAVPVARKSTGSKTTLDYSIDGKPITNPSVNNLANVAYFYTKGVDDKPRVHTGRLTEILAGLGVDEPRTKPFKVKLPNGKILAGTRKTANSPAPRASAPKAPVARKPRGTSKKATRTTSKSKGKAAAA